MKKKIVLHYKDSTGEVRTFTFVLEHASYDKVCYLAWLDGMSVSGKVREILEPEKGINRPFIPFYTVPPARKSGRGAHANRVLDHVAGFEVLHGPISTDQCGKAIADNTHFLTKI